MAHIYAYAPDAQDCASIGLVGALLDEDAEFSLMAGEFGALSFRHPVDPWGKHRALVNGAILKTLAPMRVCPGLREDGGYIASVDEYAVAVTATKNQRCIYSKRAGGGRKKLLKPGQAVTVTGVADASDDQSRYKVKLGKVSGWMERGGLTLTRRDVPVAQDAGGLEAEAPSYAVRQQLFRICEVSPATGSDNPGYIEVKARRIVYDLLGNLSLYRCNGVVSCREACEGVLRETLMAHDFSIYSDIADTHVGFDAWDRNPIEALLDPEDGIAARWGAEVAADDYDIYILRRAGLDRGVRIDYGRNLLGVTVRVDGDGAARVLRPRGENKDGSPLYLDGHVVGDRHGYNYDAGRHTCADWLPEGYRFLPLPGGGVEGSAVVRADYESGAAPGAAMIEVKDAKVEKGGADVTAAVARRRLAAEAVSRFEGGCDAPEISMDVDFVLLGDTAEYAQYRHLEPLFVYDTVRVRDGRIGLAAEVCLTGLTWDVRQERVARADFGALSDVTATISGWQVSRLDGGRILPGTLGGGQLRDDIINARHIQAESVNTGALQAESVTAEKLSAGAVTAEKLSAGSVTAGKIAAGAVTANALDAYAVTAEKLSAGAVTTDKLAASAVTASKIAGKSITADQLAAGIISADSGLIATGAIQTAQIADGSITAAKIVSLNADVITAGTLSVKRLVIVGNDGLIYEINAAASGLSQQELADAKYRQYLNGTVIVAKSVTAQQIAAATITGNEIAANAIKAGNIDAASLVASQAFIDELKTRQIVGDETITMIAGTASAAQTEAEAARDALKRAVRIDAAGLHVGDSQGAGNEVLIDSEAVNVVTSGAMESKFTGSYIQFGNYQLRRTADGGLAFKMKEE